MLYFCKRKREKKNLCRCDKNRIFANPQKREKSGTALSIIKATAKETFETIVIPVLN